MDVRDAVRLAEEAIDLAGLNGWAVALDRAKVRFGVCRHATHTISLSRALVEANEWPEVRDTILHEIAHAVVGPGHGHDATWRATARKVGARPERCYGNEVTAAASPYALVCPCGYRAPRHRRTNRQYIHRTCGQRLELVKVAG